MFCFPVMALASGELKPGEEHFIDNDDDVELPESEVPTGSYPVVGSDIGRNQGSQTRLSDNFWLGAVIIPFALGIAGVGIYVGFYRIEDVEN